VIIHGHFSPLFAPSILPPRIPEGPFVRKFWPSRFDVRCCISRSHLVKSEFSIDFQHNIVSYKRLRAERARGQNGFVRHVLGFTSLVASQSWFRQRDSFRKHGHFFRTHPRASPFVMRISRPGVPGPRPQHRGASPARIAALHIQYAPRPAFSSRIRWENLKIFSGSQQL
jgi:hypothetical protein